MFLFSKKIEVIILAFFSLRNVTKIFEIQKNRPEVFLEKGDQKIYSKFTGEHPCQSVITIKLQSNLSEDYVPKKNLRMNLEKYSITYTFPFTLKVGTSCNEQ